MKVSIIVGSHRPNSQSLKVARYLSKRITELTQLKEQFLLDLAETEIPFWEEGVGEKDNETWKPIWSPIEQELDTSTCFIIVSPEWGGMVPAKLKNFFLLANAEVLGHKPALIVSISSGIGGSYPVHELRISSYKNTKLCYIPEHLIVRYVTEVLNETPTPDSKNDTYIRLRIDYALQLLDLYNHAFLDIRSSGFKFNEYPFGM